MWGSDMPSNTNSQNSSKGYSTAGSNRATTSSAATTRYSVPKPKATGMSQQEKNARAGMAASVNAANAARSDVYNTLGTGVTDEFGGLNALDILQGMQYP